MSWRRQSSLPPWKRRPDSDTETTQTVPALTDAEILRDDPAGVFGGREPPPAPAPTPDGERAA